jgi:signal transduction histidine kinase
VKGVSLLFIYQWSEPHFNDLVFIFHIKIIAYLLTAIPRAMKRFFGLLMFLCSSVIAIAQNNLPPVFEIRSDTALVDTLPNKYWQMLEDKNGSLAFEQVSKSSLTNKFHYDTSKKINYDVPFYWFRFSLKNTMDHKIEIGFNDPPFQWITDWYIITGSGVLHKHTGYGTPWSKDDALKLDDFYNFLPVTIEPGQTAVLYKRIYFHQVIFYNTHPKQFFIAYGFTDKVITQNYIKDEGHYFKGIHDSFFFGVMLLAAVFNFFFFLIVRERMYLYFALYVFFLGFGNFNEEFYHVFLREHPLIYYYVASLAFLPAEFFMTFFVRSLLHTKKYYPGWDKFLFSWNLLYATSYLALFFLDHYLSGTNKEGVGNFISYVIDVILHISVLITLFLFLKRNIRFNRQFLLAIIPAFTIWVIGEDTHWLYIELHYLFNVQLPGFDIWLIQNWGLIETICLFWQVLCFSWFLFHYFVELRKQVIQKELEKEIERSQLIEQQKSVLEEQVTERTAELRQSLQELKSTQAQLIQSEKMASLGELTAGIAHEIQNPLNFVNNFSEVNKEMLQEMQSELKSGNVDEAIAISSDIIDNEEKINHHGKRADSIVKGMLQHSRASSGQKELTDINKLADEYLRLSYHGMRARDKNFNAEMQTDFDETIGKINVVPQDIGRVLLNLFNNAFYAVYEKKKTTDDTYQPTVTVQTKELNDKIEIRVSDNGNGIPKNIIDKIYQPFFTTKPTGQGTGLGLSLAYDIIKAHGGEIKVETKEHEGSGFMIQLPII